MQAQSRYHRTRRTLVLLLSTDPVRLHFVPGVTAVVHMPEVVLLALYPNARMLTRELRPARIWTLAMLASGGLFTVFSALFFLELFGLVG